MPAHGSSAGLNCGTAGLLHPIASQKGTQDLEKPLDSGNGVSCSIILAEPVIFLMGIDHDRTSHDSQGANATTLLRGILRLNVTKAAKIKSISLRFSGRARTIWPEGIPPQKQDVVEEIVLQSELMPFFNAFNCNSEHSYGDLCIHTSRDSKSSAFSVKSPTSEVQISPQQVVFSLPGISNRASKHGPGSSAPVVPSALSPTGDQILSSTQVKGYKVFYPGLYDYSFEMPIDSNMPESTNLPLASVKWELEACVERAGAFKANLSGKREVPIIRSPSQDFLELVEPIAVSRTWDHQLHYEIIISGKSFPIGTKIPIAFKLTPLAKVQVHKLKVFLSEKIDYFAKDRTVQRRDRKISILLLKKCAGKPLAKEFWPSEVKVLGGERTPEEREVRRTLAIRRRETEALQNNTFPEPLPEPADNLLGDIDLGMEEWWGPTEIEMNVQLPTCEDMERDRSKRLAHDCTWKNVHVHHWLKIVIRLSRADTNDPSKRRHYEISVDSPISLLSCRATQANLSLPEYSDLSSGTLSTQPVCGCASTAQASRERTGNKLSNDPMSSAQNTNINPASPNLVRPVQAYLSPSVLLGAQRPIHLMRYPSFQPPPFDAEEPPPPITTPPPLYDHVIGTPSHDGLADYFARLGEYELTDDKDSIVTVRRNYMNAANLRTHGGRIDSVIDINRDVIFGTTASNNVMTGIEPSASAPS